MASFRFDLFKGVRPRVSPRHLPRGEGRTAQNVRLGTGALEPLNGALSFGGEVSVATRTLFRVRNNGAPFWLHWAKDIDVARGPVLDDDKERIYYTGEDEPRMTYLDIIGTGANGLIADYRKLGIPAPTTAPTVTGDALPADAVTGTVTAFATPNLKADFTIDQGLPANVSSWYMALTEADGTPSDNGYEPQGTSRTFRFDFPVGLRLRVTDVPDSDTIVVEDADAGDYVAAGIDASRSGQTWWRTEDTGTTRAGFFRFYLPNGIKLTAEAHALQVGDVIRVTAVASPIGITFTAPASVTQTGGHFFGWESDNGAGDADNNTWPAAPVAVGADSFYYAGARSYPFVDVWVDQDGAGSTSSFDIKGQFSFQLVERDGKSYSDIVTDIESRAYVYTFVSALGEEGPPSPVSDIVTIPTEGKVVVGGFEAPPSEQRDITHIRIYRANTGSQLTEFQFVEEIASPFADYIDDVADIDLGEVLQTASWEPPPEALEGIIALPNGVLAGFYGKTLCFSEPNFPHAWPPEYQKAVDHDIVGLGVLPNGVAVLTNGPVYIAAGDHPRAMSLRHFTNSQACCSKRSIVSTIDSVIYSSPDGLASVGAGGFRLLTEGYVRKKEWQEQFRPTEIFGFWHDQKYVGFHTKGGFIFSPEDDSVGLSTHSVVAIAGHLVAEDDDLYVATNHQMAPVLVGIDNTSGSGAFRHSTDGGATWASFTDGDASEAYRSIAYSPKLGRFCALGLQRTAISDDGGHSWTEHALPTAQSSYGNIIWSELFEHFYCTGRSGGSTSNIYRSEDGTSWTLVDSFSSNVPAFLIELVNQGLVAAVHPTPALRRQTNDGKTFTVVSGTGAVSGIGNLAYSSELGKLVVAGGGVWSSTGSWQHLSERVASLSGAEVAWSPSLGLFVVISRGDVYTSIDGDNWDANEDLIVSGADTYNPDELLWSENFGSFVASGNYGAGLTTYIFASADGVTWEVVGTLSNVQTFNIAEGETVTVPPNIAIWDAADPLNATWRSGRVVAPYPLNLAAARIVADEYPVTLRLYNDRGTLVTERTVQNSNVFRLPGGYMTDWFEVEIEAAATVSLVHLAETVEELLAG